MSCDLGCTCRKHRAVPFTRCEICGRRRTAWHRCRARVCNVTGCTHPGVVEVKHPVWLCDEHSREMREWRANRLHK